MWGIVPHCQVRPPALFCLPACLPVCLRSAPRGITIAMSSVPPCGAALSSPWGWVSSDLSSDLEHVGLSEVMGRNCSSGLQGLVTREITTRGDADALRLSQDAEEARGGQAWAWAPGLSGPSRRHTVPTRARPPSPCGSGTKSTGISLGQVLSL